MSNAARRKHSFNADEKHSGVSDEPPASMCAAPFSERPSFAVLGVRVDAVQIPDVIARMQRRISERNASHFVAVTGMHGITESTIDPDFKRALAAADLVVPDGMPLVWLGRHHGFSLKRRVYGPELMEQFCLRTAAQGYRHFFYGGAPGVADDLAARFLKAFPGFTVAGTCCPPFRPLTPGEDREIVAAIESARADIVWVGLGTPKQERWMYEHRHLLNVPVLVGVGAAFDFHTGRLRQAPPWMSEHGLEWLFRLVQEPRRLWRRYILYGSKFVVLTIAELLGLKKFD